MLNSPLENGDMMKTPSSMVEPNLFKMTGFGSFDCHNFRFGIWVLANLGWTKINNQVKKMLRTRENGLV